MDKKSHVFSCSPFAYRSSSARSAPWRVRKLPHQASRRLTRSAFAGTDVSAHRAVALFDPPPDGSLTCIIGAIQLFLVGPAPFAIARQPTPQVPAIQKQQTQPIGQTGRCSFVWSSGLQGAPMQLLQFGPLLRLAAVDQFALPGPGELARLRRPSHQWLTPLL
jgi:hypothetical protein